MDEDRVLKWLFDVYGSIEEIESFLPETKRSVQLLEHNVMFKRALERNIEVIGEAINRVYVGHFFKIKTTIIAYKHVNTYA
jgi:uncharacterized protein with HEPN domain